MLALPLVLLPATRPVSLLMPRLSLLFLIFLLLLGIPLVDRDACSAHRLPPPSSPGPLAPLQLAMSCHLPPPTFRRLFRPFSAGAVAPRHRLRLPPSFRHAHRPQPLPWAALRHRRRSWAVWLAPLHAPPRAASPNPQPDTDIGHHGNRAGTAF